MLAVTTCGETPVTSSHSCPPGGPNAVSHSRPHATFRAPIPPCGCAHAMGPRTSARRSARTAGCPASAGSSATFLESAKNAPACDGARQMRLITPMPSGLRMAGACRSRPARGSASATSIAHLEIGHRQHSDDRDQGSQPENPDVIHAEFRIGINDRVRNA